MGPTDLSAPKTALRHPQEHTAWVRPSVSSTIVVRCSIVVAAPVDTAVDPLTRQPLAARNHLTQLRRGETPRRSW